MVYKSGEIAILLEGTIIGDPEYKVGDIKGMRDADAHSISFFSHERYRKGLRNTAAGVLVTQEELELHETSAKVLIRVPNIEKAKRILINSFASRKPQSWGISENASICPDANMIKPVSIGAFTVIKSNSKIGKETIISDQVYIGNDVKIGENCIIFPGVRIHDGTVIGNRVIIKSNAVIGSEGFGFSMDEKGKYRKIHHLGHVILEDDVEIGSNTVIDRATLHETRIGQGVKLDNLIQIAHNVVIKENTIIAAQTGIAGSSVIGKNCTIGGQVGIAGHLQIGDETMIQAKSGLSKSIGKKRTRWYGYPAIKYIDYLRSYSVFRQLPQLFREFNNLKKDVEKLKDRPKNRDI